VTYAVRTHSAAISFAHPRLPTLALAARSALAGTVSMSGDRWFVDTEFFVNVTRKIPKPLVVIQLVC
jgi:hypothetical protein